MAYSSRYLPGTAVDWPGGLENIYRFNGFNFNDLHSGPDLYKLTKIDGLYDAEVRDSREANPGRHGETAYEGFYAGKTITFEGVIKAGNLTKLRNMIAALQLAFADISEEKQLLIYDYAGFQALTSAAYIYCKKSASINIEEANSSRRMERTFSITLKASDPFVYATEPNAISIGASVATFRGRVYDGRYNREYDSYPEGLDSAFISNNGNFNHYPYLRMYGPFDSCAIINNTTGQQIVINSAVASGYHLTYDVANNTIVDSNGVSRIDALDYNSDRLYLKPGSNEIRFAVDSFTAPDTYLYILYKDTYI